MSTILAPALIAFIISIIIGPIVIPLLQKLKFGQIIRDDGPQSHLSKQGTPTMGGLMIVFSVIAASVIFIRNYDIHMLIALVSFVGFGLIGFIDDALIIRKKHNKGLRAWQKSLMQLVLSTVIAIYTYVYIGTEILIPFSSNTLDMGIWIIPFVIFIFVAATNSVNLTDGLDGLSSGVSIIYFSAFVVIFAGGLITVSDNLIIITTALAGGCLGFIFFNRYPARIFMGDTGSLALGGMVAYVAVASKAILWLPIMGLMFVLSTVSVIIQVGHYKRTKKRVFKMAPLHHHFEHKGYHETTIVVTYVIITIILSVIGIMAFK